MAAPPGDDTAGAGVRMLPAGRVTAPALRGLSRFADTRGLPASRECLLDYDVIEAFCVAGLAGRAPSTRGTYRSALYRLAGAAGGPAGQRATPFPGAKAPPPYSRAERAEPAAQRGPAKRSSALALIVFGIGAGLRPGELAALRGSDVSRHGRQVMVRASGPPARVVPVASRYAGRAGELARHAGSGFVFRPGPADRSYKNFVTNFARGLAADPAGRPVTAPRPVRLHLRPSGRGHPGPGAAGHHRDRRGRVAGPLRPPRPGRQLLHRRPAGPLPRGDRPVNTAGLTLPPPAVPATRRPPSPPSSSTAPARPRSSRRRWPTAPGGPARRRRAPC
jgi:integrase